MALGFVLRHGVPVPRLVLALVLLTVGCSGSEPPAAVVATTSLVLVTTTTTTTEVVPFETEVKQAAIALLEIRNEVFQHPDVSRVAEYIAPTCVCLDRERGFIERFVNEGLRWTAGPIEVVGLDLSNPDEAAPTLTVVAAQAAADLVGIDGSVAQHVDQLDDTAYSVSLVASEHGGWLVNGLEGIVLDEPTTAAIVAEGLP